MAANLSAANQQEQLRQQYLQALGVDCWLPRIELPAASPSRWAWQPSVDDTPAVVAEPSQAVKSAVRANQAPLRQLLNSGSGDAAPPQDEPVQTTPVVADAKLSRPAAEPAQSVEEPVENTELEPGVAPVSSAGALPQFRLALIAFPDCLVVTDLPLRSQQGLSAEHLQLLDAIVRALGRDSRVQGQRQFQWPLDPHASFDQSEPIARRALELELSRMAQNQQSTLLLMGQQAGRYLLPVGHEVELGVLLQHRGQQLLCSHGLNEVLRLPGLKAELWRQLQPLRLNLGGS